MVTARFGLEGIIQSFGFGPICELSFFVSFILFVVVGLSVGGRALFPIGVILTIFVLAGIGVVRFVSCARVVSNFAISLSILAATSSAIWNSGAVIFLFGSILVSILMFSGSLVNSNCAFKRIYWGFYSKF